MFYATEGSHLKEAFLRRRSISLLLHLHLPAYTLLLNVTCTHLYSPALTCHLHFLSIFSFLVANITGICSLIHHRKNQRDCTRSRVLLLISLSISDIATCVCVSLKSYVSYALHVQEVECASPMTFYCTKTFLDLMLPACQTISLLNLLGMAIDHWITFIKPFRYFEVS